jgi:hypothetical protein
MTVFPVSMAVQEQVVRMEQAVHLAVPAPAGRMDLMEHRGLLELLAPQGQVVLQVVVDLAVPMEPLVPPELMVHTAHQEQAEHLALMAPTERPVHPVLMDHMVLPEHLVRQEPLALLAVVAQVVLLELAEQTVHTAHRELVELMGLMEPPVLLARVGQTEVMGLAERLESPVQVGPLEVELILGVNGQTILNIIPAT